MSVDKSIEIAIREAVAQRNFNKSVADKLISWFSELASGNETIEDRAAVERHITAILNVLQ